MLEPSPPVTGALVADLPHGTLTGRDAQQRLLALPVSLLDNLVAHAPNDTLSVMAHELAKALEPEARIVLSKHADPSPEAMAQALSIALATRGLGTVSLERWGAALTLIVHNPPGHQARWKELLSHAVAYLVGKLMALDVHGALVHHGAELQVLLASKDVCAFAQQRTQKGDGLLQILAALDASGASVR